VRPGGHFPGQCSNCHETDDWDDVDFSHDGLTNCNSCHTAPNDDDHEGNVPQCSECHNTQDWDDADDDFGPGDPAVPTDVILFLINT
jgi:hypothetical protein